MAVPTKGAKGFNLKAGFVLESAGFGVVSEVKTEHQLYIIGEALDDDSVFKESTNYDLDMPRMQSDFARRSGVGILTLEANYEMLWLLWCTLGKSYDNSPTALTDAYGHWLEPDRDLADRAFTIWDNSTGTSGTMRRRGTIVLAKNDLFWEYASAMIDGFSLNLNPADISARFNIKSRSVNLDPIINTSTTGWSLPLTDRLIYTDAEIYLQPRDTIYIYSPTDAFVVYESSNITITPVTGTYTGHQYAKMLERQLNSTSSLNGKFTVDWDSYNKKLHFRSDVSFKIVATAGAYTMEAVTGFYADTAMKYEHISVYKVECLAVGSFAATDKIIVRNLTLDYQNGLIGNEADKATGFISTQPYMSGNRSLVGSFEMARYLNNDLMDSLSSEDVWEMKIIFTGGSIAGTDNYTWEIYIPQVKFTTMIDQVAGPQIYAPAISFKALSPERHFDFENYTLGNYYWRSGKIISSGDAVKATVNLDGTLHIVTWDADTNTGKIFYESGSTYVQGTGTWTGAGLQPFCAEAYGGYVFVGLDNNHVYRWQPTVGFTDVRTMAGDVVDMCIYKGWLWVVDDTGRVDYWDGSAWTTSVAPTITNAWRIYPWKGQLYVPAISTGNFVARIYNGSSWSTSNIAVATAPTVASISGDDDWLYITGDAAIWRTLGTGTWTSLSGWDFSIKHLIHFGDRLLGFPSAASTDPYVYYPRTQVDVNIYSSWNKTMGEAHPIIFKNKLLICQSDADNFLWFDPRRFITMYQTSVQTINPMYYIDYEPLIGGTKLLLDAYQDYPRYAIDADADRLKDYSLTFASPYAIVYNSTPANFWGDPSAKSWIFDGTDDYARIDEAGSGDALDVLAGESCGWDVYINVDSAETEAVIIGKSTGSTTAHLGQMLVVNGSTGQVICYHMCASSASVFINVTDATKFNIGGWNAISMYFHKSTETLYCFVNGQLFGSTTSTGAVGTTNNGQNCIIGGYSYKGGGIMTADLSVLRFFKGTGSAYEKTLTDHTSFYNWCSLTRTP